MGIFDRIKKGKMSRPDSGLSTRELAGTQMQRLGRSVADPTDGMRAKPAAGDLRQGASQQILGAELQPKSADEMKRINEVQQRNNAGGNGLASATRESDLPGVPTIQKTQEEIAKINATSRRNLLSGMSFEDAMKRGNISPAEYVKAMNEKAKADGRELSAYETTLNALYAMDEETPEQKRRKERMAAIGEALQGVGDLVGNVANMYYAHRGGIPVDLNGMSEERRRRAERISEKREAMLERERALLGQATARDVEYRRKQAEAKAEREARAAERDAERRYQEKKEADTRAYEEAKVKEQRAYQSAEAEKSRKHQATESARSRAYQREQRDRTQSSVVGKDGYTYTFTRPLEDYEIQRLLHNTPEGKEVIKQLTSIQKDNNDNEKKYIDWNQAFALAQANGWINERDLISMGGKRSGTRATRFAPADEVNESAPKGNGLPSFVKSVPGASDNNYWTKGYPKLQ